MDNYEMSLILAGFASLHIVPYNITYGTLMYVVFLIASVGYFGSYLLKQRRERNKWMDPSEMQYDQPAPHPPGCNCSWCKDES